MPATSGVSRTTSLASIIPSAWKRGRDPSRDSEERYAPRLRLEPCITRAAQDALDEVHQECDLLLFPGSVQGPEPIGRYHERGALVTGYLDTARVAFQPLWNLVGRPAIMLPWDRDSDGLPTAVQFGAPPRQERLLLQLAGELEAPRRWDERRPPV
jgi:amidase